MAPFDSEMAPFDSEMAPFDSEMAHFAYLGLGLPSACFSQPQQIRQEHFLLMFYYQRTTNKHE